VTLGFDPADTHGVAKSALQLRPPIGGRLSWCARADWPAACAEAREAAAAARDGGDAALAATARLAEEAAEAGAAGAEAELRHARGRLLGKLGRPGEALEEAERALAVAPPPVPGRLWVLRGAALCALARWAEAHAALDRAAALELAPSDELQLERLMERLKLAKTRVLGAPESRR